MKDRTGGIYGSVPFTPTPGAKNINLPGGGFGSGPTVVLFDRMEGTEGAAVSLSGAEIGTWDGINDNSAGMGFDPKYVSHGGRTWMSGRDTAQDVTLDTRIGTGLRYHAPSVFNEFYFSYRWVIPTGYAFIGETLTNYYSNSSPNDGAIWKPVWFGNRPNYVSTNDCIFPNFSTPGNVFIWGNGVAPEYLSNPNSNYRTNNNFSGVNDNLQGFYISGSETVPGVSWDATIETTLSAGNGHKVKLTTDSNAYGATGGGGQAPIEGYDSFLLNGWIGTGPTNANVLPCFTDVYLATGANAAARIYTHDQPLLANSTEIYLIPPDSWTDTDVSYTPKAYEDLTYRTVFNADLTAVVEGV